MEIKIETIVTREVLENVFVTAIEGGSNYWCHISDDAIRLIRIAVPKSIDPYLSTAILKSVLDHDVEVPINDEENKDEVLGYINKKTIQERILKLSLDDSIRWALEMEINEEGDAESSDVVFQYLVMEELVFG